MKPLGLSQNQLVRDLRVPPRRIHEIVHGHRALTPDTALRLSRYFGTSSRFWLGLQVDYDLEEKEQTVGKEIELEVEPRSAA